jgi:hypothetical protein
MDHVFRNTSLPRLVPLEHPTTEQHDEILRQLLEFNAGIVGPTTLKAVMEPIYQTGVRPPLCRPTNASHCAEPSSIPSVRRRPSIDGFFRERWKRSVVHSSQSH